MKWARFIEIMALWFFVAGATRYFTFDEYAVVGLIVGAVALAVALAARDAQYENKP